MAGRLDGKTAIVTGGASGIGRACAVRFAEEGADVVIADLAEEQARRTLVDIERLGRRAIFVASDVCDVASTEAMAQAAVTTFGRLDVVVAAAGISHAGYVPGRDSDYERTQGLAAGVLLEKPLADWEKVMRVNATGILLVDRAAARRMIAGGRGGSIINVTSIAALTPTAGLGDYCVSKAGAWMITRVLALELGSQRIRVNAIAPGITETPMTRAMLGDDEVRTELLRTIPLGRFGQPSDIAHTALFLASDESAYITGKTITVDGARYPG